MKYCSFTCKKTCNPQTECKMSTTKCLFLSLFVKPKDQALHKCGRHSYGLEWGDLTFHIFYRPVLYFQICCWVAWKHCQKNTLLIYFIRRSVTNVWWQSKWMEDFYNDSSKRIDEKHRVKNSRYCTTQVNLMWSWSYSPTNCSFQQFHSMA